MAAFVSPRSHRNRSPAVATPAQSGRCIALRHAERCGSRHFLCNGAQSFGKEWETVCVSGLPRTKTTNPKQERKSYYEKQQKYPDLHRRRTLHPRDLREFIAGRHRRTMARLRAARSTVTASRSRLHGHRQLEREHRSQDAGPGHAQRLLRWRPSLGVRVQRVDAGLVVRRRLCVRGVRRLSDGDARYEGGSGDVLLACRTRRRLPARASLRLADVLRIGEPRRWIRAALGSREFTKGLKSSVKTQTNKPKQTMKTARSDLS